ncbi:MAG: AbrB/MazE/SpoVT family DNA-binding domain-containing protein [Candidatus Pacebacteria bacterium]|nr:AbrB/MazE/SpoVT family DNA-binding domain-containing protein [Candidatus Paceibacterota bacterium]
MKIQTIVQPNQKGQIVIPKAIRQQLGITSNTQLHLVSSASSFVITPLTNTTFPKLLENQTYADVLEETKGAWANDSWPETQKSRDNIERIAADKPKKAW